MPEQIFMKLVMYINSHQPISKAYVINPSHPSVCLHLYHPTVARQPLGKNVTAATNTRATTEEFGRVFFYAVHVTSKDNSRLILPRTSCSQTILHVFQKKKMLTQNFK
jgi:hypothetical protein